MLEAPLDCPLDHELADAGTHEFWGVFHSLPGFLGPFDPIFASIGMVDIFSRWRILAHREFEGEEIGFVYRAFEIKSLV